MAIEVGNRVCVLRTIAESDPRLRRELPHGGTVEEIRGGIAYVRPMETVQIPLDKLTSDMVNPVGWLASDDL